MRRARCSRRRLRLNHGRRKRGWSSRHTDGDDRGGLFLGYCRRRGRRGHWSRRSHRYFGSGEHGGWREHGIRYYTSHSQRRLKYASGHNSNARHHACLLASRARCQILCPHLRRSEYQARWGRFNTSMKRYNLRSNIASDCEHTVRASRSRTAIGWGPGVEEKPAILLRAVRLVAVPEEHRIHLVGRPARGLSRGTSANISMDEQNPVSCQRDDLLRG